jgi:hypothetical protein
MSRYHASYLALTTFAPARNRRRIPELLRRLCRVERRARPLDLRQELLPERVAQAVEHVTRILP